MHFKFLLLLLPLSLLAETGYVEPWGKDSSLTLKTEKKEKLQELSLIGKIANGIILFHQNVLTKADGSRSHFRPTSSRYMQLAIARYGFLKGYLMGCDRLLRENNEKWIYHTIIVNNVEYKYDPALSNKHFYR